MVEQSFNTFIEEIDTSVISESAKVEFQKNPTQWHRIIEHLLLSETEKLEEKDARPTFRNLFSTIHEKIGVKVSLEGFVSWMSSEHFKIDTDDSGELILISSEGKDRYQVLDTFGDKFLW
ncbi:MULTISPECIES: hypothetical protein [unclassified Exiguobacterium]|uniref:hypothetical protein n=1 Tax=unclassified Exiguobacterium TaxID=2644629 RepID=UPI001BE731FC|nr:MULTISPECIES: hypothetical protein [unclassified Exiguobacterium]